MPGSNALQNQPLDILISISQILDHESLLRLRLVSQSLSHVCTPYALRHVAIFLVFKEKHGELLGDIMQRFYEFRDNPELVQTLARHAHRLTIHLVGSDFKREDLVPDDAIDAICEGLKRFKSIKSLCLKWKHEYSDLFPGTGVFINNLQDRFCDSILEATGYSLEELTLIPGPDPPPYIPASLSASSLGLRSLQFDKWGWYCLDPKYIANIGFDVPGGGNQREDQNKCPRTGCDPLPLVAVQKIIQSNPTLERLHVIHGCMLKGFGPEYIFPQRSNPSPLTSLIIKGFNLTSVSSLIPANSLRNLTHLTAQNPASQFKYDFLWSSLKAAHAELKSLATYQVSYSLCVYLASYNSLQELVITEIENDADSCSEKTVSAFFDDALPQHAETLRKLKVAYSPLVNYDSGWALSKNHNNRWGRALFKLTALTSLHIEPRCTLDLRDAEDFSYSWPTAAPLIQEYRTTLDYIAEVAPQVDVVEFLWPDTKPGRAGRYANNLIVRCGEVIAEVERAMHHRSSGPGELILGSRAYQPAFDQDKGILMYIKKGYFSG